MPGAKKRIVPSQLKQDSQPGYSRTIKIGFVPMTDCAPLILAHELALFDKYDLRVKLARETGWATIREKMLHEELDAAHAPASMVFEMSCGLRTIAVPSLTGIVMAHNGNGITLSNELWEMGVRDVWSLKRVVERERGRRTFNFAGVLRLSSQHYLIRKWLLSGGIVPEKDVGMVMVPPPLVFSCLERGYLDGYCVAEPWSSIGLLRGQGWCASLSADLDPIHPEKVFVVSKQFDEQRREEHIGLIAALIDAAAYCDQPENRPHVAEILSRAHYLDVSLAAIENGLVGPFQLGRDRVTEQPDTIVFSRMDANRPTLAKARWVQNEIYAHGLSDGQPPLSDEEIGGLFREDLYEEACRLTTSATKTSSILPET